MSEQSASTSIRLPTLGRIVVEAPEQSNRSAGMPDYGEGSSGSRSLHHGMSREDCLEAVLQEGKTFAMFLPPL